jgi:hypothetical protein
MFCGSVQCAVPVLEGYLSSNVRDISVAGTEYNWSKSCSLSFSVPGFHLIGNKHFFVPNHRCDAFESFEKITTVKQSHFVNNCSKVNLSERFYPRFFIQPKPNLVVPVKDKLPSPGVDRKRPRSSNSSSAGGFSCWAVDWATCGRSSNSRSEWFSLVNKLKQRLKRDHIYMYLYHKQQSYKEIGPVLI